MKKRVLQYNVRIRVRRVTDFSPRSPSLSPSVPSDDGNSGHDGNPDRGYGEESGQGPRFYNFPQRDSGAAAAAAPPPKVPAGKMKGATSKPPSLQWVPKKVPKAVSAGGPPLPASPQKAAPTFPKGETAKIG